MITIQPSQPIFIEYVINTPFNKKPEYINCADFLKEQVASAIFPSVKNRISVLSYLEDNWDGFGAVKISDDVTKNTYKFVDAVNKLGYCPASADDIYATPYGTIVLEFRSNFGLVSIEIGREKIGYFTDFNDKNEHNNHSDGIDTDFRIVPLELRENLAKL